MPVAEDIEAANGITLRSLLLLAMLDCNKTELEGRMLCGRRIDWNFTDAYLNLSAQAFHNPDSIDIAANFYRNRLLTILRDPIHADLATNWTSSPLSLFLL